MNGELPPDEIDLNEHVLDERDRFLAAAEQHRRSRSTLLEARETEVQKLTQPSARLSRALKWRLGLRDTTASARDLHVFYVYMHRHPATESVFYVGKGVDARAWEMLSRLSEHTTMLYELLKEGGYLALTTPNTGGLLRKLTGHNWVEYKKIPEHLYFFNFTTIHALLEKSGFLPLSIRSEGKYVSLAFLIKRVAEAHPLLSPVRFLVHFPGLRRLSFYVNATNIMLAGREIA